MENTTCKSHFSTRKRQRANFIGSRTRNLACGDPRSLKRPNRQPFSPNISNQSNIFKCPAETYKLLFESTKVHCVLYQESLDKCFSRFRFQVHLQKAILLNPLSTKRFTNSNSLRIINQKTKNCIYTHFNETLLFQQIPTLSTPHKQYLIIKIHKYIKIPQKPINQTPVQCKPTSQKSRFHKASNHFQYVFFLPSFQWRFARHRGLVAEAEAGDLRVVSSTNYLPFCSFWSPPDCPLSAAAPHPHRLPFCTPSSSPPLACSVSTTCRSFGLSSALFTKSWIEREIKRAWGKKGSGENVQANEFYLDLK